MLTQVRSGMLCFVEDLKRWNVPEGKLEKVLWVLCEVTSCAHALCVIWRGAINRIYRLYVNVSITVNGSF